MLYIILAFSISHILQKFLSKYLLITVFLRDRGQIKSGWRKRENVAAGSRSPYQNNRPEGNPRVPHIKGLPVSSVWRGPFQPCPPYGFLRKITFTYGAAGWGPVPWSQLPVSWQQSRQKKFLQGDSALCHGYYLCSLILWGPLQDGSRWSAERTTGIVCFPAASER